MIKVCDAIMGTGKSSAAITYMNEHKGEKFIYITPYLDEAERIRKGCKELHFVEPSNKLEQYHFKKCEHTAALIKQGKNITTTHQAFKRYSADMLDDIRRQKYHLIIDENMDVLEQYDIHSDDMQMALDAGYIKDNGDSYELVNREYQGRMMHELFEFLKMRDLIKLDDVSGTHLYYWVLPPELMTSFSEVIILTYLFEGQGLHHFLHISNLPYNYIGIEVCEDGKYRFCDSTDYIPEYVKSLKDRLHIIDKSKLNDVGSDYHALSMNWFNKNEDGVEQLKKNIYNCMNNIWRGTDSDEKMCGAFNSTIDMMKGKGYSKSFTTFNLRATNHYRNRKYLVYITNLFMNVGERLFYKKHGIEVDEDMYALSIMVQWIWRSAIRDGNEVYIYIPSIRMRTILTNWIENISSNKNVQNRQC